jgi:hypothetical protein
MADSIRMIDLAGLTRGLDEFRRMDPEQRALADRLAARAAARQHNEVHKDVANAEGPTRARVDEHHGQGPDHDRHRERDHPEEEETKDASPEREEGLLLDIKV